MKSILLIIVITLIVLGCKKKKKNEVVADPTWVVDIKAILNSKKDSVAIEYNPYQEGTKIKLLKDSITTFSYEINSFDSKTVVHTYKKISGSGCNNFEIFLNNKKLTYGVCGSSTGTVSIDLNYFK